MGLKDEVKRNIVFVGENSEDIENQKYKYDKRQAYNRLSVLAGELVDLPTDFSEETIILIERNVFFPEMKKLIAYLEKR